MRQALSNLVELLVEAGTDVLHLVDVTIYLADIRDLYEAAEVWNEFFTDLGIPREQRPVRNVLQSLVSKDKMLKVELYAQAVLPAEGETALRYCGGMQHTGGTVECHHANRTTHTRQACKSAHIAQTFVLAALPTRGACI